jgi:hypothetical protein
MRAEHGGLFLARWVVHLKSPKDSVSQSPCAIGAAKIARAHAWIKDAVDSGFDTPGGFGGGRVIELVGQPVEHQGRGQNHGRRIGKTLAHDVGRRTVTGLKHRMSVADIGRRRHTHATDDPGA